MYLIHSQGQRTIRWAVVPGGPAARAGVGIICPRVACSDPEGLGEECSTGAMTGLSMAMTADNSSREPLDPPALDALGEVPAPELDDAAIASFLDVVLDVFVETLRADRASILLFDPQTRMLSIEAARGLPEQVVRATRVPLGQGIVGLAVQERVPLLLKGLEDRDYRIRAEVCASLGNFKNNAAVINGLLDRVNHDERRYARSAGLYSLQKIGDRRVLLPLYDLYAVETDPLFRDRLKSVVRGFINR